MSIKLTKGQSEVHDTDCDQLRILHMCIACLTLSYDYMSNFGLNFKIIYFYILYFDIFNIILSQHVKFLFKLKFSFYFCNMFNISSHYNCDFNHAMSFNIVSHSSLSHVVLLLVDWHLHSHSSEWLVTWTWPVFCLFNWYRLCLQNIQHAMMTGKMAY